MFDINFVKFIASKKITCYDSCHKCTRRQNTHHYYTQLLIRIKNPALVVAKNNMWNVKVVAIDRPSDGLLNTGHYSASHFPCQWEITCYQLWHCWYHSHLFWGSSSSCQAEPDHNNSSGQDEEAQDNASDAGFSGYTCQPIRPACFCTPKEHKACIFQKCSQHNKSSAHLSDSIHPPATLLVSVSQWKLNQSNFHLSVYVRNKAVHFHKNMKQYDTSDACNFENAKHCVNCDKLDVKYLHVFSAASPIFFFSFSFNSFSFWSMVVQWNLWGQTILLLRPHCLKPFPSYFHVNEPLTKDHS